MKVLRTYGMIHGERPLQWGIILLGGGSHDTGTCIRSCWDSHIRTWEGVEKIVEIVVLLATLQRLMISYEAKNSIKVGFVQASLAMVK